MPAQASGRFWARSATASATNVIDFAALKCFHPLTPTRIADTRSKLGGAGTLGPAGTATLTAPAPIAVDETSALVANITGVNNGSGPTCLTT